MISVDLNCDLGESFGAYTIGMDEAVIPLITSANVACGYHAGDPLVMAKTVARCREAGVHVGAQTGLFGGEQHFASAERQKGETVVHFADALDDGARQLFILCRHVVERAVRLDVAKRHTGGAAEGGQRAELILDIGLRLGRGNVHAAAAKAHQIG